MSVCAYCLGSEKLPNDFHCEVVRSTSRWGEWGSAGPQAEYQCTTSLPQWCSNLHQESHPSCFLLPQAKSAEQPLRSCLSPEHKQSTAALRGHPLQVKITPRTRYLLDLNQKIMWYMAVVVLNVFANNYKLCTWCSTFLVTFCFLFISFWKQELWMQG